MALLGEIANLEAGRARVTADAQRRVGDIYAGLASNLGAIPGQVLGQIAQQKTQQQEQALRSQEMQIRQQQLDAAKRHQVGQQVLSQAIQQFSPNGTPDHQKIANAVSQAGFPDLGEAWLKTASSNAENLEKLRDIDTKRDTLARQTLGDLAFYSKSLDEFTSGIALAHATNALTPEVKQMLAQAQSPDDWSAIRANLLKFSPKYTKQQEELQKPTKLGPDESIVIPATAQKIVTGPAARKTEAELAADAANPESPTAAQSKAAIEMLKVSKGTAEQDDQRYRGIQAALLLHKPVPADELAWAKGYEKQKTLGVDTSASEAAKRQGTAIEAQTKQQKRAQDFAESQSGRKELTDKVEQPYLDAREKAETLRSVIEAAKRGNMEAASVQSLLGTLGLVTTEGVKRINTTELQQVAGAGSLLERIKGAASHVVSGKPLSDKLQSDLADLSKLLEQSARQKYERGFKSVTDRYGLKDEKPLEDPNVAPQKKNPFR